MKIYKMLILTAILIISTTSNVIAASDDYKEDVNQSYHSQLPGITPEARTGFFEGTWPYGSSMYDKWCGLPNMVMTFNMPPGMGYNEMLMGFTNNEVQLNVEKLNTVNPEWKNNDIFTADADEWDQYCGTGGCHVGGGGLTPNSGTADDIQCEACHDGPNPVPPTDGQYRGDTSCLKGCHITTTDGTVNGNLERLEGEDFIKRGMDFTTGHDVHAGNATFEQMAKDAGYGNNTCLLCHVPGSAPNADPKLGGLTHNFGRGWTTDTSFDYSTMGTVRACNDPACHEGPHEDAILNKHTDSLECTVCHSSKSNAGISVDDWTQLTSDDINIGVDTENAYVQSKHIFDEHDVKYYWRGKAGGDWGPQLTVNDENYIIYPFMNNPAAFRNDPDAQISVGNEFEMIIWVYADISDPSNIKMMGIDRDLLWAADRLGNQDYIVDESELEAIGFIKKGPYSLYLFDTYPVLSVHNINLDKNEAYSCMDCHNTNDGVLNFSALGYEGDPMKIGGRTIEFSEKKGPDVADTGPVPAKTEIPESNDTPGFESIFAVLGLISSIMLIRRD
jgi:hypothetical protein